MNRLEIPPEIDPFINAQAEPSLPPQPSCDRLSDVLTLMEPRLGSALLDGPGRAAVRYVADRISTHLSCFWGLEIRLGDPARRADILWEVVQGSGGIATLAGRNPHDPAAGATAALRGRSPFWRELGDFAEEWLDNPEWCRRVGNIWLEVDAAAPNADLDAQLDEPSLFWGWNPQEAGSDRKLLSHLAELGRRFYGLAIDPAWLDSTVAALPGESIVFQMGVMGARANPAARLCVKELEAGAANRWLAAIGWPGDRRRLSDALAVLAPVCGDIALNVDILPDGTGAKLGLELYSPGRRLSIDVWRPILDRVRAQGLARADKLAALENFPWHRRYRQMGVWSRTPPRGYPVLVTNLHHLKLVFVNDAAVEAKAYLAIYRPVVDYSPILGLETSGEGGWLTPPPLPPEPHAATATGSRSEGPATSWRAR